MPLGCYVYLTDTHDGGNRENMLRMTVFYGEIEKISNWGVLDDVEVEICICDFAVVQLSDLYNSTISHTKYMIKRHPIEEFEDAMALTNVTSTIEPLKWNDPDMAASLNTIVHLDDGRSSVATLDKIIEEEMAAASRWTVSSLPMPTIEDVVEFATHLCTDHRATSSVSVNVPFKNSRCAVENVHLNGAVDEQKLPHDRDCGVNFDTLETSFNMAAELYEIDIQSLEWLLYFDDGVLNVKLDGIVDEEIAGALEWFRQYVDEGLRVRDLGGLFLCCEWCC
ncbi:Aste57867_10172 [Aphanomyces stellatus]|uniref:Aste57867_10172 protein n=1 Tax=Aphanomyces stellatus TaxID=120398 RepID=A0A485KPP5_9STRA|nr:hypothetical protein As57867_010133 [Aphanomyces stellatus]VFT87048.1 Aste57867_10172 [Aphanomyces stellatus]